MASKILSPLSLSKPSPSQPISVTLKPSISFSLHTSKTPLYLKIRLSQKQDPSSAPSPPSSREEAINQAKISLSSSLQRPLNNISPLPSKKLKRQKQPRYTLDIPMADETLSSLTQLVLEVFSDLPINRKGAKPRYLLLWPNSEASDVAHKLFSPRASVENLDLGRAKTVNLNSADIAVFISAEPNKIEEVKSFCESFYPKPVVLFNPKWDFEEEGGGFLGSFEVVYSFVGLEVRGLLSRRKGAVFRCVKDGVFSGEGWAVLVEDEEKKGEMKVAMRFRRRPSMAEVENVLYNLQAANSPVTKSVKFLKDLVDNVQRGGGRK